jgi:hypothetical protein
MADTQTFQDLLETQKKAKVKEQVGISQAAQTYALEKQKDVLISHAPGKIIDLPGRPGVKVNKADISNEAHNVVRDFIGDMDRIGDGGFNEFKDTMETYKVLLREMGTESGSGAGAFTDIEKSYISKVITPVLQEIYPLANMFAKVRFGFKDLLKQFRPLKLAERFLGDKPIIGGFIQRAVQRKEAGETKFRQAERAKARAVGVAGRKETEKDIAKLTGDDFGMDEEQRTETRGKKFGTFGKVGSGLGGKSEEERTELFQEEEGRHEETRSLLEEIRDNTGDGGILGKTAGKGGIFNKMFTGLKNNFGKIVSGLAALRYGPKVLKSLAPKILTKAATTLGIKTTAKAVAPAAVKAGTKIVAPAAVKAGTKIVATQVAQEGVEAAAKGTTKVVAKTAGKTLLKSAIKKIPLIGFVAGLGFGLHKLAKGDFTGAAMEVASGAMSIVPGIGTAGSVGMDLAIAKKDIDAAKAEAALESGAVADGAVEGANEITAAVESKYISKKNVDGASTLNTDFINVDSKRANVRLDLESGTLENIIKKIMDTNAAAAAIVDNKMINSGNQITNTKSYTLGSTISSQNDFALESNNYAP